MMKNNIDPLNDDTCATCATTLPTENNSDIFYPTLHLRWYYKHNEQLVLERVLQQLWQSKNTGNIEWRDIPSHINKELYNQVIK